MQGVQWMKVRLLPHDDIWHEEFNRVKQLIYRVWGEAVVDVQHVGSTSIRSISAKPILDVAVVLRSFAEMDVEALENEGYRYMGVRTESGDRRLFIRYAAGEGAGEVALEHVHCYEPENADFAALVGFRITSTYIRKPRGSTTKSSGGWRRHIRTTAFPIPRVSAGSLNV